MTREEILDAVVELAGKILRPAPPVDALVPGADLAADLGLDSIQMTSLVVELENRFEICFEPEDEQGIRTLGDVVEVILARRRRGGAA